MSRKARDERKEFLIDNSLRNLADFARHKGKVITYV